MRHVMTPAHYAWRVLIHGPLPPPLALAIDEAIALCCTHRGGRATLRFYQWDRPAISLGRFQVAERAVHLAACQAAAIPLVRRITGGRAVWHHQELTYSVSSPLPSPLFPSNLNATMAIITAGLADGLGRLGVPLDMPRAPSPDAPSGRALYQSSYCFATTAWYELRSGGKKVVGSAQRRWRDRLLQQGSILLQHDPGVVRRWLRVEAADADGATGLFALLPRPIRAEELARRLARAAADHWGVTLEAAGLTDEERALADHLARHKYASDDWTLRAEAPRLELERR
jgi:lipoate-protein ligase A